MKRYFIEIDGKQIEVTKEISDEYRDVRGPGRRERYVIYELAPRYELSLDGLVECGYPVELHTIKPLHSSERPFLYNIAQEILLYTLDQLKQNERELIVAIFYEGLNDKEVARLMDIPYTTFWNKKQSILRKMKKVINNLEFYPLIFGIGSEGNIFTSSEK